MEFVTSLDACLNGKETEMSTAIGNLFDPGTLIAPLIVCMLLAIGMVVVDLTRKGFLKTAIQASSYNMIHSDVESNWYVDVDKFLRIPRNVEKVGDWFESLLEVEEKVNGRIDRLAFLENEAGPVGAISLKDFICSRTGKSSIIIRLRKEIDELAVKGAPYQKDWEVATVGKGERIMLVSDVATSGWSIHKAAKRVETVGGRVDTAVVLFDRGIGASELLRQDGVRLLVLCAGKEELDLIAPRSENSATTI